MTTRFTTLKTSSGGSSSTTDQIYSGMTKAWVNFNGQGSVAIRSSFNVNSITDNASGDFTMNFSTAMVDANYAWTYFGGQKNIAWGDALFHPTVDPSSTAVRFVYVNSSDSGPTDPPYCNSKVIR